MAKCSDDSYDLALRIGLISDTHGLLRPEAVQFLRGSDHIVHAGDIGKSEILDTLASIAPVTAIRGNNDESAWAQSLAVTELKQFGGVAVYVLHNLAELDLDPHADGIRVVVSGHSHRPRIAEDNGVLYINPGSAGPRRFRLPITAGEIVIADGAITPRIIELPIARQ